MKAIYEVKFYSKSSPGVCSDSRRIARDASNKGFQQVAKWALDVCGKDEFIGTVNILATEQL